ncbi:MAG: arginine--tRNA ligase [Acidobacteria bacterium]|nr:MAG: arginine--tRNA ligase [Acidobacteriota bacterium]
MKELLKEQLLKTIVELYSVEPRAYSLEPPREETHGDYATNAAFLLAKELRRKPQDIAQEIAEAFPRGHFQAEAVKGFVNFRAGEAFIKKEFKELLKAGESYFFKPIERPLYLQVEFVSANPTGPLHIGHGRGAVVGDVLCRVLEKLGHRVVREYYVNDAGNQVYLLGLSLLYRYYELFGIEREELKRRFEEEGYKGSYIRDLAKDLKAFYGDRLLKVPIEEGIQATKEYAYRRLLEDIKETLLNLGVSFDSFFSERELYKDGTVDEVLSKLQSMGYIYEKDGALWFKSSQFGDDKDRVVRKSDQSYTYYAGDIAYHWNKFKRGFEKAINLWGADHHGYERRLLGALKALGVPEGWLSVEFVQMVRLISGGQEVRMSKRTGEFITLQELLEEVGKDAVRFIFLTKRSDTPLDFDLDLVKRNTSENPVFYVQYAHARIRGVFREVLSRYGVDADREELREYVDGLSLEQEIRLMKRCIMLKDTMQVVAESYSPHLITYALIELAKDFHNYYNHHRIMLENRDLMLSRLSLLKGVELSLKTALDILGVRAPDRM